MVNWKTFATIISAKQGPAIFITLEGKAREAILELDVTEISSEIGFKKITNKLSTVYAKDKVQTTYECYDRFGKFQRSQDMKISNFIIQFKGF